MRKLISISLLMTLSSNALAFSQYLYVGADTLYTKSNFRQGYGSSLFSNSAATQINFFIGSYLSSLLGIEVGYQRDITKNRQVTIPANSNELGVNNFTNLASNTYNTSKKLYGVNFNYVPKFQFTKLVAVVGVIGVVFLHSDDVMDLALYDGGPVSAATKQKYYAHFAASQKIPRLGVRLQSVLFKNIGLRASYIWENTARLNASTTREINPSRTLQTKFSNTTTIGLGVLVVF